MSRALRIVIVTLGLSVAGAMVGGMMGLLAGGMFVLTGDAFLSEVSLFVFAGAEVAAVLGPVAAWLLMRHVPLGQAIGGTALGTLAGAVVGNFIMGPLGSFVGAFLGFGAAAVHLRLRTPEGTRRLAAPADPAA